MNLIMLKDFLSDYSIPTLIISVIIAITKLLLEKICKSKLSKRILGVSPFLLGIVLNYLYGLICGENTIVQAEVISAGIITGTLACTISLIIKKLCKGEPISGNMALAIIEGLVCGYVKENAIKTVITEIYSVYSNLANDTNEKAVEKITNTLHENSNGLISFAEFIELSKTIIKSLDEIIKE